MNKIFFNKNKYTYFFENLFSREYVHLFFYSLLLFFFPLVFSNQFIVGVIVNTLLIKSVIDFDSKKVFLLALIPSTSAFFGGLLFANLSPQLLLMLPIIWLANFSLMILTRFFFVLNKKNYFFSTIISSITKTIILFGFASIFFSFSLVPVLFLTVFGLNQLITALAGSIIVFIQLNFWRDNN